MLTGDIQMDGGIKFTLIIYVKAVFPIWPMHDIPRLPAGVFFQSECFHRAVQVFLQLLRMCNRCVQHKQAARRDPLRKSMEGTADIIQRFEIIQMVRLHIQNYADKRGKLQETVKIFACLRHKIRRMSNLYIAVYGGEYTAYGNRRVFFRFQQNFRNHGGRRRFSMRTRDSNGILIFLHDMP